MRTLLTLTVAATVLGTGLSIKCYQCNSHLDKDCMELPSGSDKFLTECGDEPNGEQYTLCRKVDMYLDMDFGKYHPAENRIMRDCGYVENDDPDQECYYKSGYNTRTWVCACKEDGCNAATLPSTASFLVMSLAALVAVLRGAY